MGVAALLPITPISVSAPPARQGNREQTIVRLLTSLADVMERPSASAAASELGDGDGVPVTSTDYQRGSYAELEHVLAALRQHNERTYRHVQRRYLRSRLVRRELRYTEKKVHGETRRTPILPPAGELARFQYETRQNPDGPGRKTFLVGVLRVWDSPVDPQHIQNGLRYLAEQWPTVCVSCDGAGRTRSGRCQTCRGTGDARKPTLPPDMTVAA